MMKNLNFYAMLAILFLGACSGNRYEPQIKSLDSLVNEVNISKDLLLQVDSVKAAENFNIIIRHVKHIEKNFPTDKITTEDFELVNSFRAFRKKFNEFPIKKLQLLREMAYTKTQCNQLQLALKEGKFNKDEAIKYYDLESLSASNLNFFTREIVNEVNAANVYMDTFLIKINNFYERYQMEKPE
jgi:hypothetical protein